MSVEKQAATAGTVGLETATKISPLDDWKRRRLVPAAVYFLLGAVLLLVGQVRSAGSRIS